MSSKLIDLTKALEQRQFQVKEERLQKMREAFRAARLSAKPAPKTKTLSEANSKRNNKARKPSR
jgi:hypothetical protein